MNLIAPTLPLLPADEQAAREALEQAMTLDEAERISREFLDRVQAERQECPAI